MLAVVDVPVPGPALVPPQLGNELDRVESTLRQPSLVPPPPQAARKPASRQAARKCIKLVILDCVNMCDPSLRLDWVRSVALVIAVLLHGDQGQAGSVGSGGQARLRIFAQHQAQVAGRQLTAGELCFALQGFLQAGGLLFEAGAVLDGGRNLLVRLVVAQAIDWN